MQLDCCVSSGGIGWGGAARAMHVFILSHCIQVTSVVEVHAILTLT